MATLEDVLAQALKLDTLDQVKLISTLAHRVEEKIRSQPPPPPAPQS